LLLSLSFFWSVFLPLSFYSIPSTCLFISFSLSLPSFAFSFCVFHGFLPSFFLSFFRYLFTLFLDLFISLYAFFHSSPRLWTIFIPK
jgi:hypothetical protein